MIRRVVCGISGGVDSAIAAYLLKQKGFEVVGVFMRNWDPLDESGTCLTGESDLKDAKRVCEKLDIEFHEVSFIKEYWNDVFSSLLQDYENGFTPNPDILCNRFVKFGSFYKYAKDTLKADAIATGHYAKSSFDPYLQQYKLDDDAMLLKAQDYLKDQTFFLSQINQEPLRRTIFPLGNLYKAQVRETAVKIGLDFIAKKKESTGICFIGNRKFSDFITQYISQKRGPFIHIDTNKVIGWHRGIHEWTLGQRCKIGGLKQSFYVAKKDVQNQIIYISDENHPILSSNEITTFTPHWISSAPKELGSDEPLICMFKFQHTIWPIPCLVWQQDSDRCLKVRLSIPKRAVTPGQFAVFYQRNICLGSAKIISATLNDTALPNEIFSFNHPSLKVSKILHS